MTAAQRPTDNHVGNLQDDPDKTTTALMSFEEFLLDILKRPERDERTKEPGKAKRRKKLAR